MSVPRTLTRIIYNPTGGESIDLNRPAITRVFGSEHPSYYLYDPDHYDTIVQVAKETPPATSQPPVAASGIIPVDWRVKRGILEAYCINLDGTESLKVARIKWVTIRAGGHPTMFSKCEVTLYEGSPSVPHLRRFLGEEGEDEMVKNLIEIALRHSREIADDCVKLRVLLKIVPAGDDEDEREPQVGIAVQRVDEPQSQGIHVPSDAQRSAGTTGVDSPRASTVNPYVDLQAGYNTHPSTNSQPTAPRNSDGYNAGPSTGDGSGYGAGSSTGINEFGYDSSPSNGYDTGPNNNVYNTGPSNNGYGTGPSNNGYHTGPSNDVYNTGPSNNGYGTGPSNNGYHTGPSNNVYNTGPSNNGYGTGPSTSSQHTATGNNVNGARNTRASVYFLPNLTRRMVPPPTLQLGSFVERDAQQFASLRRIFDENTPSQNLATAVTSGPWLTDDSRLDLAEHNIGVNYGIHLPETSFVMAYNYRNELKRIWNRDPQHSMV